MRQLKASTRAGSSIRGDLLEGFTRSTVNVVDRATLLSSATSTTESPPLFVNLIDFNRWPNGAGRALKRVVATGQSPQIESAFGTLRCHLSARVYGRKPDVVVTHRPARMAYIMAARVDGCVDRNGENRRPTKRQQSVPTSTHHARRPSAFNRTVYGSGMKAAGRLEKGRVNRWSDLLPVRSEKRISVFAHQANKLDIIRHLMATLVVN